MSRECLGYDFHRAFLGPGAPEVANILFRRTGWWGLEHPAPETDSTRSMRDAEILVIRYSYTALKFNMYGNDDGFKEKVL